MKKINHKFIWSFLFLCILSIVSLSFKNEMMDLLRWLLESNWVKVVLIILICIIIICHSIFVGESSLTDAPTFNTRISKPLDIALSIGTYVAITSTAITLLKGAYIQQFYGDVIYFNEFQNLDIYSLLGVSMLLLWYVIFHVSKMLGEALFITVEAKKVKGVK